MAASVFITGGSSLLALNWAAAIREQNGVTLGLHERSVSLRGVVACRVDLESVERLMADMARSDCGLVVHTAGFTSIEGCETRPEFARHVNVILAENVAVACARLGLPLVHVSTDHLFAGSDALLAEEATVAPVNAYGRSKAEAEARVLAAHPGALVVRTNFYGWGPSYRRSFSDTIIDALRSGREMYLFEDVFYTPILAEAVALVAHELVATGARGIVHVVGAERLSKLEFGLRLAAEFGLDAALIRPSRLAWQAGLTRRPLDMSLSNRRACALIGREFGGLARDMRRLHQQEQNGLAREIQNL